MKLLQLLWFQHWYFFHCTVTINGSLVVTKQYLFFIYIFIYI